MNTLTPTYVYKLSILIQTGLIDAGDYYPWADKKIEELQQPPVWLLELATEKNPSQAAILLEREVVQPHQEELKDFNFKDFFAAAYYVKSKEDNLSWNNFLLQAGICADGPTATIPVYDFYEALQEYVNDGQKETTKEAQEQWVEEKLTPSIKEVKKILADIKK